MNSVEVVFQKLKEENPLVIPFQIGYRAHVPLLESFVQFDESIRFGMSFNENSSSRFRTYYCSRITNIGIEVPNQMQTKITGRISYSLNLPNLTFIWV
jgi:hypothetical protein